MAKHISNGEHYDSYEKVLDKIRKDGKDIHLLLGNGFSIAYDKEIFSYNALMRNLEAKGNNDLLKLFDITKTANFEVVMRELDTFISVSDEYGFPAEISEKLKYLKENLEKSLIESIEEMHPECIFNLTDENIRKCGEFIEPYFSGKNSIISSNYDLLLYWVLMRYKDKEIGRPFSDGFSYAYENGMLDEGFVRSDNRLIWNPSESQNIFYIHGALHIFDNGTNYQKEQYDNKSGDYIMKVISDRINDGDYPVFVTAGDASQKLNQIMHNGYLADCYNHLKSIKGRLVTLGFRFGDNDTHIIDAINEAAKIKGGLLSLYIGVFSQEDRDNIDKLVNNGAFACKVNTFDAKSVKIW